MTTEQKPWLDKNGEPLSDEKIMKIKDDWSLDTWEEFLTSQVEYARQESLLDSPDEIDTCQSGYTEIAGEFEAGDKFTFLHFQVKKYLRHLNQREKKIIRALFWEGLSQRELAEQYGLSRAAITGTRDRALKKLGSLLIDNILTPQVFRDCENLDELAHDNEEVGTMKDSR
ncbi:MAG: sigma-70 family RNA polymerase sigma factor [Oligoflexales bacterium]